MTSDTYDINTIKNLHLKAFGPEEGPIIFDMVGEFLVLTDTISICVERDGTIAGNVLFSPLHITDHPNLNCYLLAPLGVLPEFQKQGVGKELIKSGVEHLKSIGAHAVFVLGDPNYYSLSGFIPTSILPPHHELVTFKDGWRMLEIQSGSMDNISSASVASPPIMKSMFWDTSAYTD